MSNHREEWRPKCYLKLNNNFSSISSDLLNLESEFGRFGVTDSSAPQQDNRGFPLDQGMNDRWQFLSQETKREQINQSQRLWFPKDNGVNGYDAHRSYNYERSSSGGVMGSHNTIFNTSLGNVPTPSHPFFEQSPWGYAYGYRTNPNYAYTTLMLAKDPIESQLLQDVIVEGSKETIDQIFDNLISHVFELMIDPFGHQVFQKLLKRCTNEQITRVLDIVIQKPHQFVRVCVNSQGTRAIQDLMQSFCSEEQISRFMTTLCHVALVLTKNINANHVILFCFNQFPPSHSRYLLEVIVQNFYQVAIDQHGCFMLQQCIRQSSCLEIRDPLIKEIINNALRLCVNCYGNYVVQYVLEFEECQVTTALSKHLDGNYVQLSYDRYGSHVVQKCLKSREFCSRRIITELLSDIDSLLINPFGNYVIQTAWIVSKDDVRNVLLYHINRNVPFMRCNIYGRKVLEKLNLWT